MILGSFLAEYIRKKYGLVTFYSKLVSSTPELDEKNDSISL